MPPPNDIHLSDYGRVSSRPAPVNEMMAAFADSFRDGVDINLGVGYVNERTIPTDAVREALDYVLTHPDKYRQSMNYGGPRGSQNLIDSLKAFLTSSRGGSVPHEVAERNTVIIGPSGATSILEGIANVLEPGIVVTSDPMYYIYCNFLERKGFEVVTVPEDEGGVDPEAVEARIRALGDRRAALRFIYLVTVNNPSCTILSNVRRTGFVELAQRLSTELGRCVPVMFDKAYELLVHDPGVEPLESALVHDDMGVVYEIGTLSKVFAPALRIGYLVGRDGPFLRAMIQYTSDVGFSAPLITQEMASYLLDHHLAAQQAHVNRGYREKAQRTKAAIDACLGSHVETCTGGQAGFYFYLTLRDICTDRQSPFFRFLARTTGDDAVDGPQGNRAPSVIYLPGEICTHPKGAMCEKGRRQLRISYGFEEVEQIEEALEHMKAAAEYAGR